MKLTNYTRNEPDYRVSGTQGSDECST